ncbi:hypothetical protein HMI55_000896 [Coelomomyces lativittatus]|nr:hypothetical protein HMI55_000896 [Coelomomyces lativittatus]
MNLDLNSSSTNATSTFIPSHFENTDHPFNQGNMKQQMEIEVEEDPLNQNEEELELDVKNEHGNLSTSTSLLWKTADPLVQHLQTITYTIPPPYSPEPTSMLDSQCIQDGLIFFNLMFLSDGFI